MEALWRYRSAVERNKPYIAMIFIQFVYAGMSLLSKAAITKGMNPYVFVAYRQAFATLALAPFAFFLERSYPAPRSFSLLCKVFFVSLCGITMSLNLYYFALNYTSATFATALTNTIPAITFILSVCFGVENICIRERHGAAKVFGSAIGLTGALIIAFVKGPRVSSVIQEQSSDLSPKTYHRGDWIKGSLILLSANITWSLWLIVQVPIIKQYPAKLRLTTLQCFFSCVQSAIWAVAMERHLASWKLGWNLNLLTVAYCGVIITAITYWLQVWAVEKKGPVFTAMFSPLALVITAVFSALLFKETLHWGSVCGAVLLVIGLYGLLWGKKKEGKSETNEGKSETKGEASLECIKFVYAGMSLLSKAATTEGMDPYVFVVYRQAFTTIVLAPFALFFERITMTPNLFYFALNYTSATLAMAITNTIPATTFIIAVCLRNESISINQRHGMAKALGSSLSLAGAMVLTFIKGPCVYPDIHKQYSDHSTKSYSKEDMIKGCLVILLSNTTWSLWLIMQGVIVTAITYWLQVWAVEKKGPVFTVMTDPTIGSWSVTVASVGLDPNGWQLSGVGSDSLARKSWVVKDPESGPLILKVQVEWVHSERV
ncbi:hypothetical protein RJ639_045140 [Escallonia herrerae]|uniref:EamA domain-containing protein n=1 Tax=Escallonia herrerae TaxID=1293975 RepID=A0AA89AXV4_9ASTE|nr:hypothetical protein RJ639_045140 [Escallonia herrerae]